MADKVDADIVVTAQRQIGDGQVAPTARIGILGDQDVLDTPFSTNSLTSEFIANQQANSLTEVIENDASVRSVYGGRGASWTTTFLIRGFQSRSTDDVAVNGLFGLVNYAPSINYVDRVDIFKGPSSFLNGGVGGVGGTFNFAPKRASTAGNRHIGVNYLSDSILGAEVDIGQRFGNFGARFTGVYRDGDGAINGSTFKQQNASLGLDYATDNFKIGADFIYEDTFNRGYLYLVSIAGLPATAPFPRPVEGQHRGQPDWMGAGYISRIGTVRAEWTFAKDWTAAAAYGHSFTTGGYDSYCTIELLDVAGTTRCNVFGYYSEEKNDSADVSVRGKLTTGPISHSIVFGGSYISRVGDNTGSIPFPASYTFNYYDEADRPARPIFPTRPAVLLGSKRRITGFFVGDTLGVADDLVTATVGIRKTVIRTLSFNRAGVQTSITDKGRWTPVFAGTVQPTDWLTFYGNHIKALEPGGIAGGTALNAGEAFPPLTSEQVEGGAKARFGGILATAALFRIRKGNQYLDARTNLFTQDGLQENKGIELSLAGTVLPHLNLIAGATWIDAKLVRTAGGLFDGRKAPGVPKFTSVINADYDLPWVEGVTLSGSLFYTSRSVVDNLNTREADRWARVDLGATYRFRVSDVGLVARASVENVANKRYWVTSFSNLLSQGVPRTLALSLSADF